MAGINNPVLKNCGLFLKRGRKMKSSEISGFHRLKAGERVKAVKEFAGLSAKEAEALEKGAVAQETLERMSENVVGGMKLPFGIAVNFKINGKDYLVPMVTEEPSVVAAASNAAKLSRQGGGFFSEAEGQEMIGQVQAKGVRNFAQAREKLLHNKGVLLKLANEQDKTLCKITGGAKGLEVREIKGRKGKMLVLHLLVDAGDAMGANCVNSMCEAVAPKMEEITGGKTGLRILSNYAVKRKVKVKAVWKKEALGKEAVNGIVEANDFAEADVYRAVTNNKGFMNGVDAVLIATGNDFRAVEAGIHAYASRNGKYGPIARFYENREGDLVGEAEVPMAVGIVGGATKTHPAAQIALKILGIKSAKELSEVVAAAGLANNFAALRALATEGIQKGHMKLHSRNIAVIAGAKGREIGKVAEKMAEEGKVSVDRAKEILKEFKEKN